MYKSLPIVLIAIVALAVSCSNSNSNVPPTVWPTPSPTANTATYAPGDYIEQITSGGAIREYRLHIPPGYQANEPMALVLNFHGYNSNAAQQESLSGMSVKADEAGFIAVHPEGLDETWHIGSGSQSEDDLNFIRDLIQRLESDLNIDTNRIYATGISNGAQMSNMLGCELSDTFAAIAPVSGGYFYSQSCQPSRPVPVIAFHGTDDRLIPYEGDTMIMPAREWAAGWAERNGCSPTSTVTFQHGDVTGETWGSCDNGAEVVFYTIEGGGHSWPGSDMPSAITTQDIDATDVIWEFFEAHPMP